MINHCPRWMKPNAKTFAGTDVRQRYCVRSSLFLESCRIETFMHDAHIFSVTPLSKEVIIFISMGKKSPESWNNWKFSSVSKWSSDSCQYMGTPQELLIANLTILLLLPTCWNVLICKYSKLYFLTLYRFSCIGRGYFADVGSFSAHCQSLPIISMYGCLSLVFEVTQGWYLSSNGREVWRERERERGRET